MHIPPLRRGAVALAVGAALAVVGCSPAPATPGPVTAAPVPAVPSGQGDCVRPPSPPTLSPTGTSVRAQAVNGCTVPVVFWLTRLEGEGSTRRTVLEKFQAPETDSELVWACRGSGTRTYQAVHWDPNMMRQQVSAPVALTC